jgi:hypothetical protein
MNLAEFCDEFRISARKAKAMHARGVLRLDDSGSEIAAAIRQMMIKGQPLTAMHLVSLVESPSALLELGRHAGKVQDQLEAIGDAKAGAAPREIVALLSDAARGDPEAVSALVGWIKGALPESGEAVSHAWIAARLLLGVPAKARHFDVPRIPRALMRCRKAPEFSGWWHYDARSGRKFSLYARPNFPLASWNL